jgi:putative phosphoesterase
MKILVLADIHANWPALSAIRESFDACLFLGDLVDYGSNPVPCVEWVEAHATATVRGNHDHAVAQRIVAKGGSGFRQLAAATRPLQWNALAPRHLKYLARMPVTRHLRLGTTRFALFHATPRDPMDEYLVDDASAWKARLEGIEADVVCVGHSHVQFHLDVDGLQVLNPGSVGQPRDGDPRCAYAVIEDGKIQLRRAEYDIDAAISHMRGAGLNGTVLEMAESALRTGGRLPVKFNGNGPNGTGTGLR